MEGGYTRGPAAAAAVVVEAVDVAVFEVAVELVEVVVEAVVVPAVVVEGDGVACGGVDGVGQHPESITTKIIRPTIGS